LTFLGIYLFYKTGWLPFAGILAGMFVPVAGVILEAAAQITLSLGRRSETEVEPTATNN